ncbi:MAG: hypothetical protein QM757_38615 [Paludibaculum sp.]
MNAVATHLMQSTVFAAAVALLSLAFRRNRAKVRFRLWFCASIKFLLPFSLLTMLGSLWNPVAGKRSAAVQMAAPVLKWMQPALGPTGAIAMAAPLPKRVGQELPGSLLLTVWGLWLAWVGAIRFRDRRRVRAAIRAGWVTES